MSDNNTGWIKLFRKIHQSAIYGDPLLVALWIHILTSASHKETDVIIGGAVKALKPGEFVASRSGLSKSTGISEGSIEKKLKLLKDLKMIKIRVYRGVRIVSVMKWMDYQHNPHDDPFNNVQPPEQPSEQVSVHNQEDKNIRRKNIYINSPGYRDGTEPIGATRVFLSESEYKKLCAKYGKHQVTSKIISFDEKLSNKVPKYTKFKDHFKTLNNWLRMDVDKASKNGATNRPRLKEWEGVLGDY